MLHPAASSQPTAPIGNCQPTRLLHPAFNACEHSCALSYAIGELFGGGPLGHTLLLGTSTALLLMALLLYSSHIMAFIIHCGANRVLCAFIEPLL